jgi:hypothetical protein
MTVFIFEFFFLIFLFPSNVIPNLGTQRTVQRAGNKQHPVKHPCERNGTAVEPLRMLDEPLPLSVPCIPPPTKPIDREIIESNKSVPAV